MILLSHDLSDYFHESILRFVKDKDITLDKQILFYVGEMLAHFDYSDADTPLTVELAESLDTTTLSEAAEKYRSVGDKCLFISSFKKGAINRKMQDLEFCYSLGSYSYSKASHLYRPSQNQISNIMDSLSQNFQTLAYVLTSVFSDEHFKNRPYFSIPF